MIIQRIPLTASPSQKVTASLANQACQIEVYQRSTGLFLNLSVNNAPIVIGVLCLDRNRIVRDAYRGFIGDLCFIDQLGYQDPTYDGLVDRYALLYLGV